MEIDRAYAKVNLDHLTHNYKQAKQLVGDSKVCAVVKADAYGHGAVQCAKRLEQAGCDFFAVACLKEAIELRENGIEKDILIFGKTKPVNHAYISKYQLIQTVHSLAYAQQLNAFDEKIRIHINIDTGMSRFGIYLHEEIDLEKALTEFRAIQDLPNLRYEGMYTHFANSDEQTRDFCDKQYYMFQRLIDKLYQAFTFTGIKHAANSGAIVSHSDKYLDMVRFGIGLYGYPHTRIGTDFKPVMSLYSHVIQVKNIREGDTVSYGRTYRSKNDEQIATIAIGYADGYNRLLSNKDYLLFNSVKLPVIGRVCMDAIMVSCQGVALEEGDVVEVFGENKPLESMCRVLNTIPYELLCLVSKRVKRLYE